MRLTEQTSASIAGTVDSQGNVVVTADGDAAFVAKDGAAIGGGTAGVGVSIAAIVHDNTVQANLAETAQVTARSLSGTTAVPTGEETANGNPIVRNIQGVWVGATSRQTVLPVVAGAANGATVSAAGSLVFTVLNETTHASIEPGAVVNVFANGDTNFSIDQDVQVLAFSQTILLGQAGVDESRRGGRRRPDFCRSPRRRKRASAATSRQNATSRPRRRRRGSGVAHRHEGAPPRSAAGSLYTLDITTHATVNEVAQVRAVGSASMSRQMTPRKSTSSTGTSKPPSAP